jgi:hypothetical protein
VSDLTEPEREPSASREAAPEAPEAPAAPAAPAGESIFERLPALGAARRAVESIVIAVVTSTGLYLIGSVYLEAFYGRMSIDAAALDFAPPYVALQAFHVLQALLQYPVSLMIFYFIYRALASRTTRLHAWYDSTQRRLGRLFLLIVNLLIVSPLLASAIRAGSDMALIHASSVLSEVAELMETFGIILLFYVIWLSLGPRLNLLTQIRQHRVVPIALLFALYLFDALLATGHSAALDAELLMTGQSDSSVVVEFTLADDVRDTLPDTELLLVTTRLGNFYAVERQPTPPSPRPIAYVIPTGSVDSASLRRITDADVELWEPDFIDEMFGTPIPIE